MNKKVLLIGIDGMGNKFISKQHTPNIYNIDWLCTNVQTSQIAVSEQAWYSALSGYWPNKHNIIDHEKKFNPKKSLLFNKDWITSSRLIGRWKYLNDFVKKRYIKKDINVITTNTDEQTLKYSLKYLSSPINEEIIFIYLEDVDDCGHNFGFNEKEYIKQMTNTDLYIGKLMDKIKLRSNLNEEWLILITTDHGGGGFWPDDHGENSPICRNIFLAGLTINSKFKFNNSKNRHFITDYYNYVEVFFTGIIKRKSAPDNAIYQLKWFIDINKLIYKIKHNYNNLNKSDIGIMVDLLTWYSGKTLSEYKVNMYLHYLKLSNSKKIDLTNTQLFKQFLKDKLINKFIK